MPGRSISLTLALFLVCAARGSEARVLASVETTRVASTASTSSNNQYTWTDYPGLSCMDNDGYNMVIYRDVYSMDECKAHCEQNSDCNAITYSDDFDCYLKPSCNTLESRNNGDNSAILQRCEPPTTVVCHSGSCLEKCGQPNYAATAAKQCGGTIYVCLSAPPVASPPPPPPSCEPPTTVVCTHGSCLEQCGQPNYAATAAKQCGGTIYLCLSAPPPPPPPPPQTSCEPPTTVVCQSGTCLEKCGDPNYAATAAKQCGGTIYVCL